MAQEIKTIVDGFGFALAVGILLLIFDGFSPGSIGVLIGLYVVGVFANSLAGGGRTR